MALAASLVSLGAVAQQPLSIEKQGHFTVGGKTIQREGQYDNSRFVGWSTQVETGLTINELKEILTYAHAYCGFPRALMGLQTLMAVVDERKAQGLETPEGREASPIKETGDKYARGKKILDSLSGVTSPERPTSGYGAFAPQIDRFLKEHLFADLFERDLLTYRERELTTVDILSALGGVEPMARGHLGICLMLGVTHDELREVLDIVEYRAGARYADPIREVLEGFKKM